MPTMTVTKAKLDASGAFVRCAALSSLTAVLLAGVGWVPTMHMAGSAGLAAMGVAIAIALLGAWVGTLIPIICMSGDAYRFLGGVLGGLAARFGLTMTIALILRAMDVLPARPLLLWVGIAQVAILGVDTLVLLRLSRGLKWETR